MRTIILKYTRLAIFILVLTLFSSHSYAQSKCIVKGDVMVDGGSFDNVKITLYKDSEQVSVKSVSKNGKFSYTLNFGYDFIFEFSKEDFVTKRVSVSTYVPQDILERDSRFPPCKFSIELFRFFPGIDLSIFDQPIGVIMYNNETDLIETDLSFLTDIEDELKRIEKETRLKQKAYLVEMARLKAEYNLAIKKGDIGFKKKSYVDSKSYYTEALRLRPSEVYPKDQISKIENLLLNQKGQLETQRLIDEKYNGLIELADKNFASATYEEAKVNYNAAIQVKQADQYPKDQIAKIAKIERDLRLEAENESNRLAAEKVLQEKYDAFILSADEAFVLNKYEAAKIQYTSALKLKSEELYPQKQIQIINDKLEYQKQQAAAKAKFVAEQKALKVEYNRIIKLADNQFKRKDYITSLASYEKALGLGVDEIYPGTQIQVVNDAIAREKEMAANKLKQKEIDEKYKSFIISGNKQFKSKEYAQSKQNYTDALGLKPNETYPKEQLQKLEKFIAEANKLKADRKLLDERYLALIGLADSDFDADKYISAIENYQSALDSKPKESYPEEQIKLATLKLAEFDRLAKVKEKEEEANKLNEERYQNAITVADEALDNKKYKSASSNYRKALEFKSGDLYATAKLSRISNLIVENENKTKAAELLSKKKAILTKQFSAFISEGDKLFQNKKYASSITKYEAALQIIRSDEYALKQIDLANDELAKLRQDEEKQLALKKEYEDYISSADKLFAEKDWVSAKDNYQSAIDLNYKNPYPKGQIKLIDDAIANNDRLKRQNIKLEREFDEAVAAADSYFTKESYSIARFHYKEAEEIKPQDGYVKSQLREIIKILKAKKQSNEDELLAKKAKVFGDNLLEKKEQEYKAFIDKGDVAIKDRYLGKAKAYYKKAIAVFNRDYPREKLSEIIELRFAFKSEKERKAYESYMQSGEKEFENHNYSVSRYYYKKALTLATDRNIIEDKLNEIEEAIANNKQNALDLEYESLVKKGNTAFKSGELSVAKFYFIEALKIKPKDSQVKENLESIIKSLK